MRNQLLSNGNHLYIDFNFNNITSIVNEFEAVCSCSTAAYEQSPLLLFPKDFFIAKNQKK